MDKVSILIVEDDVIIAGALRAMLEELGYQVPAVFRSGREVLDRFTPGFADIVLMDIQLKGEMNGIATATAIRALSTAPIVYVTDNRDEKLRKQAIYETNTVQYLVKPFTRLDIMTAIDLALKVIRQHELKLQEKASASYLTDDCIFFRDGHVFRKLKVDHILLLRAEGSYCQLYYRNEQREMKSILFSENLSFLEEKLKFYERLYRVHRSYIINVDHLDQLQDNRLWVAGMEVPIGKTYKSEVRSRLRIL